MTTPGKLAVSAALFLSLIGQAHGKEAWSCSFAPRDQTGVTETEDFVEDGKVFHALFDDYSGKTGQHEIIETSSRGLVAMSHYSREKDPVMGVTLILLNKKSGALRVVGYNALSEYEDVYQGACIRK